MKQIYKKPELQVVEIKIAHLMQNTSTLSKGDTYNGEKTLGKQGFADWDDEEPGEDY